ncbi:MerR family transcriptional regulator [bacterium]|nr:MerR family transcriptional regulator [candidate division CSSED10-310 bacterium]
MLNITPQTVRVYEQRGFIFPKRSSGNTRLYTDEDVDTLRMILKLTQDLKVNLCGVEIIMKLVQQIHSLETEKERLYQMLYEAGTMLQTFMDSSTHKDVPMRSTIGTLIQIINGDM